jgi:hypothetical protein
MGKCNERPVTGTEHIAAPRISTASRVASTAVMSVLLTQFLAVFMVALALVPAGAHLLELPHKIRMSADAYRTVQNLYRGWALLGLVVIAALLSTLMLALTDRGTRAFVSSLIAVLCIAATQVIFWAFTFPVNKTTVNWTVLPDNWQQLRTRWEYSHAVSALFHLVALIAVIRSVLLHG